MQLCRMQRAEIGLRVRRIGHTQMRQGRGIERECWIERTAPVTMSVRSCVHAKF